MARKTIEVSTLVNKLNMFLRTSGNQDEQSRDVMIAFVSSILHETNNYAGFRYLSVNEVPLGTKPGINLDENGEVDADYTNRFLNTDSTRVFYHCKSA